MELKVEADLHCHILPAWDDGPPDLETSLALARRLADAGVRAVAATPHVGRPIYAHFGREEPPPQTIPDAVRALQAAIDDADIPLLVVSGAELTFADADLPNKVAHCPWLSYNGARRYVLIESTFGCWPRYADEYLYRLRRRGVVPIVAHPERLPDVQRAPRLMEHCARAGALLQITARAFVAPDSRQSGRCARELLELGLCGVIASDAHRAEAVLPVDAQDEVVRLVGEAEARRVLVENPRRVLATQPPLSFAGDIAPAQGNRQGGRKWWQAVKDALG